MTDAADVPAAPISWTVVIPVKGAPAAKTRLGPAVAADARAMLARAFALDTMPRILQLHLSWAPTDEEALASAMTEWPNGGMKFGKADIRSPFDFEQMAKLVRPEDFEGRMVMSSDPDVHRQHIQRFADLGFDRIYLHNVGRNQKEFVEVFGRDVLPKITR